MPSSSLVRLRLGLRLRLRLRLGVGVGFTFSVGWGWWVVGDLESKANLNSSCSFG